jgi:hypothetical protein
VLGVSQKITTAYLVFLVCFVEFPVIVEPRRINSCGLGPKAKNSVEVDAKNNTA